MSSEHAISQKLTVGAVILYMRVQRPKMAINNVEIKDFIISYIVNIIFIISCLLYHNKNFSQSNKNIPINKNIERI